MKIQIKIKNTYEVLSPGGNITALVEGIVLDPNLRKEVNDRIMQSNPSIEQVGFYDVTNSSRPQLLMAGGELCVNAVRALAYLIFLKTGRSMNEFTIDGFLSGQILPMKVGVDSFQRSWVEVATNSIQLTQQKDACVVQLQGITQVVIELGQTVLSEQNLKRKALDILRQKDLIDSVAAAGVTFVSEQNGKIVLSFVVWVRDIQSFFVETACGSGTIAAYLALGAKYPLTILQPSGSALQVETISATTDNQSQVLRISGPVKRLTI